MADGKTDLVVIGGGIMGLWTALYAARAGLEVLLVERTTIGAGASGGLLGALMPHMPDRWNDKKQFQLDALVSLEHEIRAMEAQTGLSAGYRRTGRLIPLAKPHLRAIALRQVGDADINWQSGSGGFPWRVLDAAPDGLFSPDAVAEGAVFDGLAARVSPRGLLRLLTATLATMRGVTIREQCAVRGIDPQRGQVVLSDGSVVHAGHIVLAAGVDSFPMIDGLPKVVGGAPRPASGTGVKGQAARLAVDLDPGLPILYSDGVYVIAHDAGGVAIGSTSEVEYADPLATDQRLDGLLAKAETLVPALAGAPILERWAGLRPRAVGRDPMAGVHPDHPRLHLMTGGFKISFGIAHRLARAVVEGLGGRPTDPEGAMTLPASFRCENHLGAPSRA
ncbi:glycine/D-amino acid oxidase-like deaminating enzyme [Rhizobium sp. PP-F2F-G48]|uniref:NAD(P)/FAD-dependent oxidoreductase n=1 Tax=Rhizobium sp. PP-F2F-G48 TaxID=2135651 RepID=UPI001043F736|nr:FAD-binding oxidoreductase [Rhizobium sp. PP-F2F-G48]TCM58394.1 glycine/D-amino acid oxidase-like deaminating enzyme [Rhizobium sp. PP-F2F-G48]